MHCKSGTAWEPQRGALDVDRGEAGFAYVAVLVILMLVTTMGLAFLYKAGTEASATMSRGSNMQAHYLAEAAANHAMWRLLHEGGFPDQDDQYYMHSLGNGRYGYKVRAHTDTTGLDGDTAGMGPSPPGTVHLSGAA